MEPISHKLPNAGMEKLIERHPFLFDEMASRPDIDIGIGWENVVDRLFRHIEALWPRRSKCRVEYVREHGGRLEASIRAYSREDQPLVDRAVLLAHFRAYYTCDECGERGEFRKTEDGWVACRCAFHQTPELLNGRLLYDEVRRPTKLTLDGWLRYDPISEAIERMVEPGTATDVGLYDEQDFDEVSRVLRKLRPGWPDLRYFSVAGDVLDTYATVSQTGYLVSHGKHVPLPADADTATWLARVYVYLRHFIDDQEK